MAFSTPWKADASLPAGDEWARLNAADQSGGAGIDPSTYTGNRMTQVAATRFSGVPVGTKAYHLRMIGNEEPLWTQSYGARTALGQINASTYPPGVNRRFYAGQETWVAGQIVIDPTWPQLTAWATLVQWKCTSEGNGPFEIAYEGGRLRLAKSQSQTYGNTNTANVWSDAATTPRGTPLKFCLGTYWSRGSDGWYEFWCDPADGQGYRLVKPRTYGWTLKNSQSGGDDIVGLDINVYRDSSGYASYDNWAEWVGINAAADQATAEQTAWISAVAPPTTVQAADFDEPMNDGALMSDIEGTVTISGGNAVLSLAAVARSRLRSAANIVLDGDALIADQIQWPTWQSGSGVIDTYLTFEQTGNNRLVVKRTITFDAASGNPGKVTADTLQSRMVVANVDSAPVTVVSSDVAAGFNQLKIGNTPGAANYQTGLAGSFTQIAERALNPVFDLTQPGFVEAGTTRVSGDVQISSVVLGGVTGSSNAGPDTSVSPGTLTDTALTVSGALRSFPIPTAAKTTPVTLVALWRNRTVINRQQTIIAVSEASALAGRSMQWDPTGTPAALDLWARDQVGAGDSQLTAGDTPSSNQLILAAVTFEASGTVSIRWYDFSAGVFQHRESIGQIPTPQAITDSGARIVIGSNYPSSVGSVAASMDWLMGAIYSRKVTAGEFEGLVSSSGVVTVGAVKGIAGLEWATGWPSDSTDAAVVLQDFSGGANHQTGTVGTFTVTTTTDAVPWDSTVTDPPTDPPPPDPSVPDAPAVTITGIMADPEAPTTGKFHVQIAATAADPSISYTPHAQPYRFGWAATPTGTVTWNAWQASNEADITGQPLSTVSTPVVRYWFGQYRSDAGLIGNKGPAVGVEILEPTSDIDAVAGVVGVAENGGIMRIYWDANPPEDAVTEYDVYVVGVGSQPDVTAPFYAGAGTVVVGGAYNGKLSCPTVTGLDDASPHDVWIRAQRAT